MKNGNVHLCEAACKGKAKGFLNNLKKSFVLKKQCYNKTMPLRKESIMDQKENKEEQFQAVIDGTENIKPKRKRKKRKV